MTKLTAEKIEVGDGGSEFDAAENPNEIDLSNPSKISDLTKLLELPKGTNAVALVMASSTVVR